MTREQIIAQGLKDPTQLTEKDRAVWNEIWASVQTEKGLNDVVATISDVDLAMQLVSRLDLERRESQQKEAYEANKKFTEAQAEIIKETRKNEIENNSDPLLTEDGKRRNIDNLEYENERFAGKGRFKALFEKYGDALKKAADHNDTVKFLYDYLSEYIAMNEQWGSDISVNGLKPGDVRYDFSQKKTRDEKYPIYRLFKDEFRNKAREQFKKEQDLIKSIRALSEVFLNEQSELQLKEEGDSLENITLFAAAEELNQEVFHLVDGDLNPKIPYDFPAETDVPPVTIFDSISKTYTGEKLLSARTTVVKDNTRDGDTGVTTSRSETKSKIRNAALDVLFPHEPSPMDVIQEGLDNCYMLAGLASLAEKAPQKIRESICDNNNGTVTVRFFKKEIDENTGEFLGFSPLLVTVDKFVPEGGGASGALWVQMFERAYAASGLALDKTSSASFLPDDPEYLKKVRALYNDSNADDFEKLLLRTKYSNAFRLNQQNKYEVVDDQKAYSDIDAGFPATFLEQVLGPEGSSEQIMPDKGSNFDEYKVESFIRKHLKNNHILTTGTRGSLASQKNSVIYDGLMSGHAYTVLDLKEKTVTDEFGKIKKEKFVVVRNPWGVMGRDYDKQGGNIETFNNGGVSDIRLSDFCKSFNRLAANKGALGDINDPAGVTQAQKPGQRFVGKNLQLSYIEQIRNFVSEIGDSYPKVKDQALVVANSINSNYGTDLESFFLKLNHQADQLKDAASSAPFDFSPSPEEKHGLEGLKNLAQALRNKFTDPTKYFDAIKFKHQKNKEQIDYKRPVLSKKDAPIKLSGKIKSSKSVIKEPAVKVKAGAKEEYIDSLKKIKDILAETDKGYSDFKNSREYKNMRAALAGFIEAAEASKNNDLAKLANSEAGKALQSCCDKYLKHSYSSIRNNTRRNTRMDEAVAALSLVKNMAKNVQDPAAGFPLCYSEKILREKVYSHIESGNADRKIMGQQLADVLKQRGGADFTREIMKTVNNPEIAKAVKGKTFDQLNTEYLLDKDNLVKDIAQKTAQGEAAAMQQKDKIAQMQQGAQNKIR